MNIKLFSEKREINFSVFKFPAGEIQVKILDELEESDDFFTIVCKEYSSDGIMTCIFLKDALQNLIGKPGNIYPQLLFPYLPYARQDRVCSPGEAASCSVLEVMLGEHFSYLYAIDIHNPQSTIHAVNMYIDSFKCEELEIIGSLLFDEGYQIVAPDKGAFIRASKFADYFELPGSSTLQDGMIQGDKIRDPSTGKLSGFSYKGDVKGKKLLIVDDICDGGGTFVGLAEELYKGGAEEVRLFVTHGIFSRGTKYLIDNGINHIYTTDTYYTGQSSLLDDVTVFNIVEDYLIKPLSEGIDK